LACAVQQHVYAAATVSSGSLQSALTNH
jgi:hypothetical protein